MVSGTAFCKFTSGGDFLSQFKIFYGYNKNELNSLALFAEEYDCGQLLKFGLICAE